jgi:hypothetical protein
MRDHACNNDFESFRKGVPSTVSDDHARELMHDVSSGIGLKESYIQNFLSRLRLM